MKAIEVLEDVIRWFRDLSGEQQIHIARWIMAAAAALSFSKLMPVLISGITGVVGAVRALTVAIVGLESSTGIGALLPIIGAAITAFASLAIGTEIANHGFTRLWNTFGPIFTQLKKAFDELGRIFAPVFQAMEEALTELMPSLKDFTDALVSFLIPAMKQLAAILTVTIRLGTFVLEFWLKLETIIVRMVTGPLKVMALLWEQIARSVAFVMGRSFEPAAEAARKQTETTPGAGHMSLAPRGSTGFESITAAWERIAKSSLALGVKTPEQEHLEVAKQQLMEQQKTNDLLGNAKPAIVY
jgi:hypothetical protein